MSQNENETETEAAQQNENPEIETLDAAPPASPELRAKILADPNVAKVAAQLGTPLEEYVNQIAYYMNNPGVVPALAQMSDEDIKKHTGNDAPTFEQIGAAVKAASDAFMAGQAPSGFDPARKNTVDMPSTGGEQVKTTSADPSLQDAIKKGRFPSKG
ncbi:MAG: hypothetical protein JNM17_05805 [Archangium sp.]|nr:hypothetical protein [Archangium sp.]